MIDGSISRSGFTDSASCIDRIHDESYCFEAFRELADCLKSFQKSLKRNVVPGIGKLGDVIALSHQCAPGLANYVIVHLPAHCSETKRLVSFRL